MFGFFSLVSIWVFGASLVAGSLGASDCASSVIDPNVEQASSITNDPPEPPPGFRYVGTVLLGGILYWHYVNAEGEHYYVPVEICPPVIL